MIIEKIANELNVQSQQVQSAVDLLDGGATVPFIARYRKEATQGLDDIQLRALEQRLAYLREMQDRRKVILKTIEEQGKLTDALSSKINRTGRSLFTFQTKTTDQRPNSNRSWFRTFGEPFI
jgi:uncharacterized protein